MKGTLIQESKEVCLLVQPVYREIQALLFDYEMLRGVLFQEENIISVFRKQYGVMRKNR